jgi:hypothetical protein
MAMAAAAAPASASGEAESLALFREWVGLLHYKCPPGVSEKQSERQYQMVGDRQDAILDALRRLPESHVQAVAVIWVAAWDVHGSVDANNPALPHQRNEDMRTIVQCAARLEPRLAAIAGVK